MADFNQRDRHFIRTEFVLKSGTPWGEVKKAFAVVEQQLGDEARWDDAARVDARDDEIVIWFERETDPTAPAKRTADRTTRQRSGGEGCPA